VKVTEAILVNKIYIRWEKPQHPITGMEEAFMKERR
jgi:hypothetical protein